MCPLIFARDAILAMALCLCLSVCLSVTSQSCIETDERIEQFLTWELPSTYPILRYKQILVFSKTESQDVNLENFATASRLVVLTKLIDCRSSEVQFITL